MAHPPVRPSVAKALGHRVRVRVGGIILDERGWLLIKHKGLHDGNPIWTPPGGGVEFGESLPEALAREVREETGLAFTLGPLICTLDFLRPPLHTVEFYFRCDDVRGDLVLGHDPEWEEQLIMEAAYCPLDAIPSMKVVPEGLAEVVVSEVASGWSGGPVHLGTKR